MTIGSGPAANECARNNMKTALNVFKEKIPEPMRTILTCRNPQTLEVAMEILFQASYACVTSTNEMFPSYGKPPNKIGHKNRQTYRQVGNNNSNNTKIFNNRNTQPHFSYNQPNPRNHYRNDIQNISNNWERRDYRNSNHNGQNQQQNNWNPFRQQDRQNIQRDNYLPRPEPMDVNNIEAPINRNHPHPTGYYRKFIKDYLIIAKPMTKYLKKDTKLNLNDPEYEKSFNTLKTLLINDPILAYPDFTKTFTLTTDASNYALGAILSQDNHPICFASRTLNTHEINYSTIEKELLAIVWATTYFRPYLFGRKFLIETDHKPLTWLFSIKEPNSKLVRWRLKLSEFGYEVKYKKGTKNGNADALSRIEPESVSINALESSNVTIRETSSPINIFKNQIRLLRHDSRNKDETMEDKMTRIIGFYNNTIHSTTSIKPIDFLNGKIHEDKYKEIHDLINQKKEKYIQKLNESRKDIELEDGTNYIKEIRGDDDLDHNTYTNHDN
ncbi:putative uncharacterized protein DDB_G0282499 [Lucilia cuprina]|uniref:putative uncharacterized protein DDB_G0282499 n=1 Tax=Lucilia cuprina TaxID=7375 RepID=UPI001F06AC96|nr:putative uncharacterized protein DDB_G0282499 [Lucilia cuprina]